MYGVGYSNVGASFISFTGASDWGFYVAAVGVARVWLDGNNGAVSTAGSMYAAAYYDTNTAYYGDFASESRMASIRIGGAGYGLLSVDNSRNLKFQGYDSSDVGFTSYGSTGAHGWQLYASGTDYGFLSYNWGAWDIRKTKGGALY